MQAHRKRKPGPSKKHAVPFESVSTGSAGYAPNCLCLLLNAHLELVSLENPGSLQAI